MTTAQTEVITDLTHYEKEAKQFEVVTEDNLEAALLAVDTFKKSAKDLEKLKQDLNAPHMEAVSAYDQNNKKYNPVIKLCRDIAKAIDSRVGEYRLEEERKQIEAQQAEIERARKEQEEAEALANMAKEEADKQRESGNVEVAEVIESQAQTLELEAALTLPKVIPQQPKTYSLPTGRSLNYRKVQDWVLPGFAKESKIRADAPIFAKVDLSTLRRFLIVDPVKVNEVLKAEGKLPAPFVLTIKHVSTSR